MSPRDRAVKPARRRRTPPTTGISFTQWEAPQAPSGNAARRNDDVLPKMETLQNPDRMMPDIGGAASPPVAADVEPTFFKERDAVDPAVIDAANEAFRRIEDQRKLF